MAEVRRIGGGLGELTELISDRAELSKGAALFDGKQLSNLARYENKLFADAAGSGASPYKVSLTFGEGREVKGRCSCMAARSRPFCKHAAALLVAWARAPDSFVTTDAPPAGPAGQGKKKSVKKGKAEAGELMRAGVAQVSTLVRELGLSGVVSLGAERPEQVRALGEALRANGLRRLAARALELAGLLEAAAARSGDFEAPAYTDLVADMLLTARKVDKHLGGEALDERHVEELIGRTWTKKDRRPVEGLSLVEYAFSSRTTPDHFLIRESRFLDLLSGRHYSEKQIVPAFLKRVEPKRSHAGLLLEGAQGGQYPGFAPHRLDLESPGEPLELDGAMLRRVVEVALPDVGAALAAFQEHRKDVFAPDLLPVALRVERLLASGERSQWVDAGDRALFLPADPALEEPLAAALEGARLRVVLGDVGLEAALPTLFPVALVVETDEGLMLRGLGQAEEEAAPAHRRRAWRVPVLPASAGAPRGGWSEAARAAGASRAAIALAEVRDELADGFANGLAALTPRAVEPLGARLRELGLEKPAALLEALAQRPDAGERLEDFIKVYQVLGMALVRLAGAVQVDAATLEMVPTHPSVQVRGLQAPLPPTEVVRRRAEGTLTRYEAATHYARHYAALDADALLREPYPSWSDGTASTFVARAVAARGPEAALGAARAALDEHHSRMVRRTALRVLGQLGGGEARRLLDAQTRKGHDAGLRQYARHVLEEVQAREAGEAQLARLRQGRREAVARLARDVRADASSEGRLKAIEALEATGGELAWPVLRQALYWDGSREVRRRAASALAWLGDAGVLEHFVQRVGARASHDEEAKTAVYALGTLGDVRGADALLRAFADGWKPGVVAEALKALGLAVLEPAVRLAEARPEVVERRVLPGLLERLPSQEVAALLQARVEASQGHKDFIERCGVYLKLASDNAGALTPLAQRLMEIPAVASDKALARAAGKALGVRPRK